MLMKSDMPDLPGKKVILARTGDVFEIISVRIIRWAGMVAVLRNTETDEERQLAIHTARWDQEKDAYILGEAA
jgi:hypothetical protein